VRWAVYWQADCNSIEVAWFKTELEAMHKIRVLIDECNQLSMDNEDPAMDWSITLLQNRGVVKDSPAGLYFQQIRS
jgi:hypothetical protein